MFKKLNKNLFKDLDFRVSLKPGSLTPDYREYKIMLPEYFRLCLISASIIAIISYTFYQSLLVFLFSLPIAFLYPFMIRKKLCESRKHTLLLQFKEALTIITSFLSAGYSTENAFKAAVTELIHLFGEDSMIVNEFKQISRGLSINKTIEAMLEDLAERSGLDDIGNFAEVFVVAQKSGGELVSIIRHTSEVIRDKITIKEEILTANAAKRYEQRVMNFIPFFIIIYMNFSSPEFFRILYTSIMGRIAMSLCLIVYLLAVHLSDKIMDIEV